MAWASPPRLVQLLCRSGVGPIHSCVPPQAATPMDAGATAVGPSALASVGSGEYRDRLGVEPICAVLPVAPSTYYTHRCAAQDPTRRGPRAQREAVLIGQIRRVWEENFGVYVRARSGSSSTVRTAARLVARWSG